jgi:hypothetical protein
MSQYKFKSIFVSAIVGIVLIAWSAIGLAQSVPNVITFQSILFDNSGNVITDESVDVLFRVLDDQNNEIYSEEQNGVQVYDGMINVMLGTGIVPGSNPATPTGGLDFTDFDPANPLFLEVTVQDVTTLEQLELTTVPYAFYAQQAQSVADGAITSEMIQDGAITINDLGTITFNDIAGTINMTQLPAAVATDTEVATADAALQTQITSNDTDIAGLQTQVGVNTTNITGLQTQITSNDTDIANLQSGKVNRSGDTMTGVLNMGGNNIASVGTVDGVDLDDTNSALNADGSIKGAGYSAIGFKVSEEDATHGTNVCSTTYIPDGFTAIDCGSSVQFIPIVTQYEGDGAGTERLQVFIDDSYILNICADSRCNGDDSDGKFANTAIILAIGTR